MALGTRSKVGAGVIAWSVVGTAIAFATASGCSGDDTSMGGGADATADVTENTPDAVGQDVSSPDAGFRDVTSPDAMVRDATQSDVNQPDVATGPDATDARPDVVVATDAHADATGGDASDSAVPSDAGGTCSTSLAALTAGEPDGGDAALGPVLLFAFDNPQGLDIGWSGYGSSVSSSAFLGETLTDGYICTGALEVYTTYTAYGVNSGALYTYGNDGAGAQDWTGRTKLHFWAKLTTSNYVAINGVQGIVHSSNYAFKRYGTFLGGTGPGLSTGSWYEFVVPLNGLAGDYAPTAVNQIEIQLLTDGVNPDGGAGAPSPTTLLVDDIWLE
jgi:hypothetical protein